MDGNICRCTGYKSIERAANQLSASLSMNYNSQKNAIYSLNVVPSYFSSIFQRLEELSQKAITDHTDINLPTIGGGH